MSEQLQTLAGRINAEHRAAQDAAKSAIERAVDCGRLLAEAKAAVPHGGWLSWVDANLAFKARQAQKYIRLAQRADALPNAHSKSHLTIDAALEVLSEPKPRPRDLRDLSFCEIEECRQLRDAENADAGVISRVLDAMVDAGEEPSRAALHSTLGICPPIWGES